MRLSKYALFGVASMLSLTFFSQGVLVFADSIGTSNATIEFSEDTTVPPVLDPTDPTDPYVPGGGDNPPTGNAGPLSLDYVSHLAFGQQLVSLTDKTYNSVTLKPFIQVTDKRSNPDGWNVTVKASPFASSDNVYHLTGAIINFKKGESLSDLGAMYTAPTTWAFSLTTNNQAVKFISANPGEGRGSWITRWFPTTPEAATNDSVTLFVPGGVMKAVPFTSTLTWTLTTAP